jgi:hypothetical protein
LGVVSDAKNDIKHKKVKAWAKDFIAIQETKMKPDVIIDNIQLFFRYGANGLTKMADQPDK